MAEFQDVMRQWGRYCKGYTENHKYNCDGCPFEVDGYCNSYPKDDAQYADQIEKHIMAWAAEHPEPVYPTWYEYLEKIFDPEVTKYPNDYMAFGEACERYHIPAAIAERLGIEPKEG